MGLDTGDEAVLREHVLGIIEADREGLARVGTEIAYEASGDTLGLDRASVEQLLRGVVALIEEELRGTSRDVRQTFLGAALPEVVATGTTSWAEMLQNGLPCWGVLLGKLVIAVDDDKRAAAIGLLSKIMGAWWRDVSNTVLPLYKARGEL